MVFVVRCGGVPCNGNPWMGRSGFYENALPPYSTDIVAAWEVVDSVVSDRFSIERDIDSGGTTYSVHFGDHIIGFSETAPHAICLAALKAVGYELER